MSDLKRIMIISWKWNDLVNFSVTDTLLEQEEHKYLLTNIKKAKDKFFDEYQVVHRKVEGDVEVIPTALVVRTKTIKGDDHGVMNYLLQLIKFYAKKAEVFVFLHRGDGFVASDVELVLKSNKVQKCFLFSDGRDLIYHKTSRQGMLGDNGAFYYKSPSSSNPEIQVADDDTKRVYQPYFEKVWMYYKYEFDIKFFELKEDLLDHFYKKFPDKGQLSQKEYFKYLNNNELLLLRIKSFIDDVRLALTKEELDNLKQYEEEIKKSYIFDDCQQNLKQYSNKELKEYNDISELLYNLFFNTDKKVEKSFLENMKEIEIEFQELIEVLYKP